MRCRTIETVLSAEPVPALDEALRAYAMARWAVQSATETALNGTLLNAHLQESRARGDLHRAIDALGRRP